MTETVQQQDPTITKNDLRVILNIIEVATQRGAFKAGELATVGNTFNNVKAFVDASDALEAKNAEQVEGEQTTQAKD